MKKLIFILFCITLFINYSWAQTATLNYGDVVSGTTNNGEKKNFTFEGFSGNTLRIRYQSYYSDMELISPSGKKVFTDSKSNQEFIDTEQKLIESGTYTILAYHHSGDASQTFSLGVFQIIPSVPAKQLAMGAVESGNIKNCEIKLFTFEGTSGTTVRIGYSSNYPDLDIISPSGKKVFSDTRSYSAEIITEQALTETGTYSIYAYTHSGCESETYRLWLWQKLPPLNATVLSFEQKISSKISQCAEPVSYKFSGAKEDLVLTHIAAIHP